MNTELWLSDVPWYWALVFIAIYGFVGFWLGRIVEANHKEDKDEQGTTEDNARRTTCIHNGDQNETN